MQTKSSAIFFDKYGSKISFSDRTEFEKIYWEVNCFNKPDSSKNENDLSECWAIVTFLIGLMNAEKLEFPVHVEKTDPPDFIISESKNDFGLEVVRMTSNIYKYLDKIIKSGEYFEPSNLDSRFEEKFSAADAKKNIKLWGEPLSGMGWFGTQPYNQAAALFSIYLQRKLEILNDAAFPYSGQMELIVHNDSHIFLGRDWKNVSPYLKEAAEKVYASASYTRRFRKIHFLTAGIVIYDVENDGTLLERKYEEGNPPF
jgi:hypothetical protein